MRSILKDDQIEVLSEKNDMMERPQSLINKGKVRPTFQPDNIGHQSIK